MLKQIKNDERGISVAEVLVAAAIFLLVIGAIYSLFISGYDTFNYSDRQIEAQQNVRAAMIRLVRETRSAYRIITDDPTNYPTDDWNLSLEGIQIIGETLTTSDNTTYSSQNKPWLQDAAPVIYKKQPDETFAVTTTGFTIDYLNGEVEFSPGLTESDVIKADYTHSAKVTYKVEAGLLKRIVNGVTPGETVAQYIVNDAGEPAFTRTNNLIAIEFKVDRYPDKPPVPYILKSSVKLRK